MSITELNRFIKLSNHLKVVLSNFKNINTIDKNDVLDLLYIQKYIQQWKKTEITNKYIKDSLTDVYNTIEQLKESILKTDEQAYNILINPIKNSNKLNKAKYIINNKDLKSKQKLLSDERLTQYLYSYDSKANNICILLNKLTIEYITSKNYDREQYLYDILKLLIENWKELVIITIDLIPVHTYWINKYRSFDSPINKYINTTYTRLRTLLDNIELSNNRVEIIEMLADFEIELKQLCNSNALLKWNDSILVWRY